MSPLTVTFYPKTSVENQKIFDAIKRGKICSEAVFDAIKNL